MNDEDHDDHDDMAGPRPNVYAACMAQVAWWFSVCLCGRAGPWPCWDQGLGTKQTAQRWCINRGCSQKDG